MAGSKRLRASSDSIEKTAKSLVAQQKSTKRPKNDANTENTPSAHVTNTSKKRKQDNAENSVVPKTEKSQETDFPRGGGSILTPLEYKEVSHKADRGDALFEDGINVTKEEPVKKKRKAVNNVKGMKGKSEVNWDDQETKEQKRIETLTFKRLTVGTMLLGIISRINDLDLVISLPNHLTGFVSITEISEALTAIVERAAETDEDRVEELPNLRDLFYVGQWVRCVIIALENSTDKIEPSIAQISGDDRHTKKRIELSLKPELVNIGISSQDLGVGMTLSVAVRSVEDHGYLLSTGINDVTGFLNNKEAKLYVKWYNQERPLQLGQVLDVSVLNISENRKTLNVTTEREKVAKTTLDKPVSTINSLLPGTAVHALITKIFPNGLSVKFMGFFEGTIDWFHIGIPFISGEEDLKTRFKLGSKIRVRIIYASLSTMSKKIGLSLNPHVLSLTQPNISGKTDKFPMELFPFGTVFDKVIVKRVDFSLGLLCEIEGLNAISGYVHISRVSDAHMHALSASSGDYQINSTHRARVLGYDALEGVLQLSLQKSVLEQRFLQVADVKVGEDLKATVVKLIPAGVVVALSEFVEALAPSIHLADIKLSQPGKKYKIGQKVKCRVLLTKPSIKRVHVTMKKSLLNSDLPILSSFEDAVPGETITHGLVTNIVPAGLIVTFYNDVHALAPLTELNEGFVQDPTKVFHIGQVVKCRVLTVDPGERRMRVSLRRTLLDSTAVDVPQNVDLAGVSVGDLVTGRVMAANNDSFVLSLQPSQIRANLPALHLTDNINEVHVDNLHHGLKEGDLISDLVVLSKNESRGNVMVTKKPLLVKAAKEGNFPADIEKLEVGMILPGYVDNVTTFGVFVKFLGNLTGLAPRNAISDQFVSAPSMLFIPHQTVQCLITAVDRKSGKISLSLKLSERPLAAARTVTGPFDPSISLFQDYQPGRITKAQVKSVKETQININLAENVQGRIHVSQVIDSFEAIKDKKHPLKKFKTGQILDVKVIGYHDPKTHRFLPITHRVSASKTVVELTIKPSELLAEGTFLASKNLEDYRVDEVVIGYINKITNDGLWVDLEPNIHGRIGLLHISSDVKILKNLGKYFQVGEALQCRVLSKDLERHSLELSTISFSEAIISDYGSIKKGMIVTGRVSKVQPDMGVIIQLSDSIHGRVFLTDLSDIYKTNPTKSFEKNQIVRAYVLSVDLPKKQVNLSLRDSRLTNSSNVTDKDIQDIEDVEVDIIVQGYVKNISDKGLFVSLSRSITARVKISELSDSYLKDWKSAFNIGQLVKGKIINVDPAIQQTELSLKESKVDPSAKPVLNLSDFHKGQKVRGVITGIEKYGVFLKIDNTSVSGLCHISEIADVQIQDISKIYSVGDAVKAIILDINMEKRKISFGLKSSYFEKADIESNSDHENQNSVDFSDGGEDEDSEDENMEDAVEDSDGVENKSNGDTMKHLSKILGKQLEIEDDDENHEEDDDDDDEDDGNDDDEDEDEDDDNNDNGDEDEMMEDASTTDIAPLSVQSGFDWGGGNIIGTAMSLDESQSNSSDDEQGDIKKKKKKKQKEDVKDITGELDSQAPQAATDYERLLLGSPNSSYLWINYMAFQLQLSEIPKARDIGERALKTINFREEQEKMNVWVALMNLENTFGTEQSLADIFKRALQACDPKKMYLQLVKIYERSNKNELVIEMYKVMIKKFSQSSKIWTLFGLFYLQQGNVEGARDLLQRSIKNLPKRKHIKTITKFAQMEFKYGEPERGRTLFEGILSNYPKRADLWSIYTDMENRIGDKEAIRRLFRRITTMKFSSKKMKFFFKKWLAYEKQYGDEDHVEDVKRCALAYVESTRG